MCWRIWRLWRAAAKRRQGRKEPEVAFMKGDAKGGKGLAY
jgi:hypothetical protein